jgi:OOP family OmpA-OmpF porin
MKLLFLLMFSSLFSQIKSQELINGTFDSPVKIPNDYGQIFLNKNVFESYGTPDLFHIDAENFGCKNPCGFQKPKNGKGFAGFLASDNEKIAFRLDKNLIKNNKYSLSFYLSIAEMSKCVYTPIVVRLAYSPNEYLDVKRDFTKFDDVLRLNNTDDWIEIQDTLIAKGGENYLIIGFENLNHKFYNCVSYYFLDEVSLRDLSIDNSYQKNIVDTISIFYNTNDVVINKSDTSTILHHILSISQNHIKKITVIGCTDSQGNNDINSSISNKRADNVIEYISSILGMSTLIDKKILTSESNFINERERRVDIIFEYTLVKN